MTDLPWQGRTIDIQMRARRFRCATAGCPRRIFTERLPEVAPPRGRRTARLGDIQRHVGFALGGEPGARLAARFAMAVSGDTLLRLVRAAAPEPYPSPRVIGINDRAWRRGQRYGTIVCDLERGRVIYLLPERNTEGARQGAPKALQAADRWHLLRNLGDALQGAVNRHRGAVRRVGYDLLRKRVLAA